MTFEEAAAILGPELTAEVDALAIAAGPLSEQQIEALVRILEPEPASVSADVA